MLLAVAKATYVQQWWPAYDPEHVVYVDELALPVWDGTDYVDPGTRAPLRTWQQAPDLLAAETGASLRDPVARMGHDSMQAALICQHRSRGADQRIADGLAALLPPDAVARGLHDGPGTDPAQVGDGDAEAV